MKNVNRWLLFFSFIVFLSACGASPLLSHDNADDRVGRENNGTKDNNGDIENTACPLSLENSNLCARLEWVTGPNTEEENSFKIYFWNKNENAASINLNPLGFNEVVNEMESVSLEPMDVELIDPEFQVNVQLWMPSMGHGSSPVTVTKEQTGVYKATRVFFIMPGKWDIRLQLKNGQTLIDQAIEKISL